MRCNPFESELERLARTLTDQFGVHVVCQGDEAWTDGRQIVLPSLPEPMSGPLERMVLGYLDHEMAHVAFSDFNVVKEFSDKHPGYEAMLNVVEDGLIERRAMQRWPGVRSNLDAMFAQIKDRVRALAAQRDPFGRFCTAVYLRLAHYRQMLGLDREIQGYEDLLDGFRSVRDTSDSAKLAEKLLTRWLQRNSSCATNAQPNGCNQPGENKSTGGPDRQESAESGNQDSPARKSPSRQSEDDDTSDDGTQRQSDGDGDTESDGENAGATANADADPNRAGSASDPGEGRQVGIRHSNGRGGSPSKSLITEVLTGAIEESVRSTERSNDYRVYTKQFDRIDFVPVADEAAVRELLKKHPDIVRRLRRGLANALRAAEKRWWRNDQDRGELSPRTLHRLCLDRPRLDVFRTQACVQGRSTAVSIVLDASGSMTTQKMDVARDALLVLLEALGDLKVVTEAFTFTTGNGSNGSMLAQQRGEDPAELRNRYSRIASLEIGLVKQFEEPVKGALRRLPTVRGTGLTPLGEAMQIGASRLFPRRENRKVMLVITDGRAGCEGRDQSAVIHAQSVAKRIERAGIELIGVGIMDESLRAIVADTIVVHQLEDLPTQLCKLLSRTLKKGLQHVG